MIDDFIWNSWFNCLMLDEVINVNNQRDHYLRIDGPFNSSWWIKFREFYFHTQTRVCWTWINRDQHAAIKIYPSREKHEGAFRPTRYWGHKMKIKSQYGRLTRRHRLLTLIIVITAMAIFIPPVRSELMRLNNGTAYILYHDIISRHV